MNSHRDYQRIARAIDFLQANRGQGTSLETLAAHINLSPHHCHKLFHRWAGITPKQFQQFFIKEAALKQLRQSQSVLDATLSCGLSSPGRLHDLMLHWEALTPGQHRNLGENLDIAFGFHATPYGQALLATSDKGICHLSFVNDRERALIELQQRWPRARYRSKPGSTGQLIGNIFHHRGGRLLPLHIWGTPFQHKVWEALIKIPESELCSYSDIARAIDKPTATRAVASAIGQNNLAVIIPCHRVIRQSGELANYRWGRTRKQALLIKESIKRVKALSEQEAE